MKKEILISHTGGFADEDIGILVGARAEDSRIETIRKTVEFMETVFGKNQPKVKEIRALYQRAKAVVEGE